MKKISLRFLIFTVLIGFSACLEPVVPNEEELITTLTYTLTPSSGGATVVLSFQDLDGDGGNAPIIMSDTLAANTSYTGRLELLNESITPVEDISVEILDEDEDHQFFYETTVNNLAVTYNDQDDNGNPVGLNTNLTTGAAGSGTLKIILKHQPDKSASGVGNGAIANAGGETDIEVTFSVHVQ